MFWVIDLGGKEVYYLRKSPPPPGGPKVIAVHRVKCMDGKIRIARYKGYDCKHWKWKRAEYAYAVCRLTDKFCIHANRPFECKKFVVKEK